MKEGWRWRVANVTDRIQCIFSVGLFWSQTSLHRSNCRFTRLESSPFSEEYIVYRLGSRLLRLYLAITRSVYKIK
jgi:hypothetical protein